MQGELSETGECGETVADVLRPFELIVVDNASGDGAREVIERCRADLIRAERLFQQRLTVPVKDDRADKHFWVTS